MHALSPTPTATPFLTIQIPGDELPRYTPSTAASAGEILLKLVDEVQKAALNPVPLKKLGAFILDKEDKPCGRSLAKLLHPPEEPGADVSCTNCANPFPYARKPEPSSLSTRQASQPTNVSQTSDAKLTSVREARRQRRMEAAYKLWEQHVPYAPPPRSLIAFAGNCPTARSGKDASDFFLPFEQIAERGIQIPDDIVLVFTQRILSFETFRTIVRTYVTQLPIPTREELDSSAVPTGWTAATYWEHILAALCSPLAMAILNGGKLAPEEFLDWTRLKKRTEGLSPGLATQSDDLPPSSEFSEPITVLLARSNWLNNSESDRSITSKAALLKHPEKLRALADNLTPRMHIAYLLSIADAVDSAVLEQEMDRVAKRNRFLNAGKSAEERAFFYSGPCLPSAEQDKCLTESHSIMDFYLAANTLRDDERLDTWIVKSASADDSDAKARLERRPARALFEAWTTTGMPVEHQASIALFMTQGFDETWAKNLLQTHANALTRIRAWFSYIRDADLDFRLNGAMRSAVARWIADENIRLYMLPFLPAMVQSDMSVAQIERILYAETPPSIDLMDKMFGRYTNTPEKIRYGLITTAQLLDRVLHDDGFDDVLIEAELRDISELSRKAAENRDRLRSMLHAVESLRADMAADTPQASQCESLIDAWEEAIRLLDCVLQPRTETHWGQQWQEIRDKLAALVAKLNYRMAKLTDPAGARVAGLLQFV